MATQRHDTIVNRETNVSGVNAGLKLQFVKDALAEGLIVHINLP
jgi:hypothetical protein